LAVLDDAGIRYCVIGGQAVNAYADPLVSLDLDLAVATEHADPVTRLLEREYPARRFAHSLNVTVPGSDLRVQIQTDPRYGDFVERAERRDVLGLSLPVAALEDVLRGKIWALQDPERRGSKRQKDLADVARLLESHPQLRTMVPASVLDRLL
jgi:hypothetical protein